MSAEVRRLPLFPLNVILFPNGALPLHVFEERYKLMMQRCLEADSRFGVVLIRSGPEVGGPAVPHSVGTVALVTQLRRLDDGRMLLSVAGQQRFRIEEVTQLDPYLEAEVELMDREDGVSIPAGEMEALNDAITRHNRLMLGMRGGWVRRARIPRDPEDLSYYIGSMVLAGLREKQELLEEPSTARRLRAGLKLLEQGDAPLRERMAAEMSRRISRQ